MTKIVNIPEEYRPEVEKLPGELRRIAETIDRHRPGHGVEMTLFLAQVFRGQNLYIRNIDHIIRTMRDDAIRAEYDLGNTTVPALATKFGLSTRMIEKILARTSSPEENQLRLF